VSADVSVRSRRGGKRYERSAKRGGLREEHRERETHRERRERETGVYV
jgi:hypothetical protein